MAPSFKMFDDFFLLKNPTGNQYQKNATNKEKRYQNIIVAMYNAQYKYIYIYHDLHKYIIVIINNVICVIIKCMCKFYCVLKKFPIALPARTCG